VDITALRAKTSQQVLDAVAGFAPRYVADWRQWLTASAAHRPAVFVKTLGKWQATRPRPLRRLRVHGDQHAGPYIEDLLEEAAPHLRKLESVAVGRTKALSQDHQAALEGVWHTFEKLCQDGTASCVAITKAVLLLSNGRIGPALDSRVRKELGLGHVETASQWADTLDAVSADIQAFEEKGVSLADAVPQEHRGLELGRLYDMALGPR